MTNLVSLNQITADAQLEFRNLLQKIHTLMGNYDNAYGAEDSKSEFFVDMVIFVRRHRAPERPPKKN
jgi:hypothetical protein